MSKHKAAYAVKAEVKEQRLQTAIKILREHAELKVQDTTGILKHLKPAVSQRLLEQKLTVDFKTLLQRLLKQEKHWIRSPSTWQPTSRNARRAFYSLAKHLMGKFPTNDWLLDLYDELTDEYGNLYPYVAQGGNIAKFFDEHHLPKLTKKQAHILLNTPTSLGVVAATRRAQVLSMGGSEQMAAAVGNSRVLSRFYLTAGAEDFWSTVMLWLVQNPMIATDQIGPVLDYIAVKHNEAPYSMKGRSATKLFLDMQEWHVGLQRAQRLGNFPASGFKGIEYPVDDLSSWTVKEVLTSTELHREGKAMRHCVVSYGSSIKNGYISIWTMALDGERHVTIEVRNQRREIVQARGFANRTANYKEYAVLRQFAIQNNLTLGTYL